MAGKTTKAQLYEHMSKQHAPRDSMLDSMNRGALFESHSAAHGPDVENQAHTHESMSKTRVGRPIPGTGLSGGPMAGQDVGDNRATNTDHPANRERNKELGRRQSGIQWAPVWPPSGGPSRDRMNTYG